MRIIAGECRGMRLFSPDTQRIRPTPDRVKGAMFSMLGGFMDGAVVLDLFAGTGSLGLEALSRGASFCRFCDNSRESLALIERNVAHCRMGERSEILRRGFEQALSPGGPKADIIFLDPPHHDSRYGKCLELIALNGVLREGGVVVAEHGAKLPPDAGLSGLCAVKRRAYGSVGVTLFSQEPTAWGREWDQ
ncbi:MAG: 16S rRNA (guanine(966)-N(2))-methyltransferase RsmD [Clostridiales Family XIII bacterium]|jgi:16S rRNA (guanine(966)-N(2))-methyltransferase RsmD|nr:16S rRNA (guanine(966)-N(2))-methyltransferase RsmD [Clostridiales Family XIII bacterium]